MSPVPCGRRLQHGQRQRPAGPCAARAADFVATAATAAVAATAAAVTTTDAAVYDVDVTLQCELNRNEPEPCNGARGGKRRAAGC